MQDPALDNSSNVKRSLLLNHCTLLQHMPTRILFVRPNMLLPPILALFALDSIPR